MNPRLRRNGETLTVELSGIGKTAFQAALDAVKRIEGRRWNPDAKVWEFPAKPLVAHKIIHSVNAEPTPDVLAWVREEMAKRADDVVTQLPHVDPDDLLYIRAADLYPHQVGAVGFLAEHPRSIVADEMGLGKTIEAIATVNERGPIGPKLVIAPSSMVGKWAEEIQIWSPGSTTVVLPGRAVATKRRRALEEALQVPGVWVIVNWEQVRAQHQETGRRSPKYEWAMKEPLFASTKWAAVIADEAHRAKNRKAQQTRGLWQLDAPIKLALTGTPILNSPDELWPLLVWVRPEQYGEHHRDKVGYHAFYAEYVEYSEGHYGKIVTGVRNADSLRFELADKLVRRTKQDVLDLPPKIRTTIPLEMGAKQSKLYREAEQDFFIEIELALKADEDGQIAAALGRGDLQRLIVLIPNAAARIVRLQQILESPALLGAPDESAKLDAAIERITDNPGHQFVVFTRFKGTVDLLLGRLERRRLVAAGITGDVAPEQRTDLVTEFQAGNIDVIVSTIQAGGVGLTLTAADTTIFVSRDWVPGVNEQAEDRLHRIGQTDTVNVLILEGRDTIDDGRIAPKNAVKEAIVASVIKQDHIEHGKESNA